MIKIFGFTTLLSAACAHYPSCGPYRVNPDHSNTFYVTEYYRECLLDSKGNKYTESFRVYKDAK